MELEGIVNKQGMLPETSPFFNPDTIQHSAEIMNDRRTDKDLRFKWFFTADSALYRVEEGEPVLYLGGRETNLVFRDMKEAVRQLKENGNYVPDQGSIQEVVDSVESGNTLRIRLSDLQLTKERDKFSYFEVDTVNYKELNRFQRQFAERVYGWGDDFEKNMGMLSGKGITKTRIYVLSPGYVRKNVEKDSALARVCWLDNFVNNSCFVANDKRIYLYGGGLRVVTKVAEGSNARKPADKFVESYKVILEDPKEAVKRMTPEIAAGVSEVLTAYNIKRRR